MRGGAAATRKKRDARGFTLVEMMIVVAIIAVLAVLAVAGYRKLITSSHTSEATAMVNAIRQAQEEYHSETQVYANVSPSLAAFYPNSTPGMFKTAWGASCSQCNGAPAPQWSDLPVHVDGPVMFGYATTAGVAGSTPNPLSVTVNGHAVTFPAPSPNDWFAIGSQGMPDGVTKINVYAESWDNNLFVSGD